MAQHKGAIPWNKGLKGVYKATPKMLEALKLGCGWNKGKKYKNKKISLANKGKHYSIKTEFKKGHVPWHKGTKGIKPAPKTAFKKGEHRGYEYPIGNIPWSKGLKGITFNSGRTHFKKGLVPWNKGIEWEEMRGENHPNWQGGTYEKDRKIDMGRKNYREWRKAVFERDNYTCIWCGSTRKLNADHIKPYSLYSELRYELSNGRTLCEDCHKRTNTYGNRKKEVYLNVYL